MGNLAITVDGLSKRYTLGEQDVFARLRSSMARMFTGGAPGDATQETLWALQDVSFAVKHGEVLGIIGPNGAGKSTLLKILSRITRPTSGCARISGRVGSLLEVGTGFHPELTGRENVFLNGAILGMSRADIRRRFDDIVEFSEVERFLDTPVKRYSSGMQTRLGFAVAAHLEPDVLIVDEVLAVGDAQFQRKCLKKMGDVAQSGRTVLFVSHRMEAIRRLCGTALLLEGGRIRFMGAAGTAVDLHLHNADLHAALPDRGPAPDVAMRIRSARLTDSRGTPQTNFVRGAPAVVELNYEINRPVSGTHVFARILNHEDVTIVSSGDCDTGQPLDRRRAPGIYQASFHVPTDLLNDGEYSITFALGVPFVSVYDSVADALRFNIQAGDAESRTAYLQSRPGLIVRDIEWQTQQIATRA